ncbi:MAG TPA: sensor histidine kinase [Acidothermaceae bacterium]|jgi:signal transduction histidine kinase
MRPAESADGSDLPLVHRLTAHRYTKTQLTVIDVIAVALIAALSKSYMPHQVPKASGHAWDFVNWASYGVAPAITLARRRIPRTTLLLVVGIAVVAMGARAAGPSVFFVLMTLYSVVAVSPRRRAFYVVCAVVVAMVIATVAGGGNQVVESCIGVVASMLLAWVAGENTRASRRYALHQAERVAEREAAAAIEQADQVSRALADERTKIARELHDIVAHAMSVIAVRSGVARMVIDTDPAEAREALSIIENTTRRSLQEMRLLVGVLRNSDDRVSELGPAPGLCDLDQLVADMAAAGVLVDVDIVGTPRALTPVTDLSAYRIVQEALTNVVRHAGPTVARVQISYSADEVTIEVVDRGRLGPQPDVQPSASAVLRSGNPSGHGLIGMRERAALFGGEVDAGCWAQGFRVKANLRTGDGDRNLARSSAGR